MARRRKTKHISYDSKEVKVFFALVFLAIAILSIGGIFFSAPVFKAFQDLFNNTVCTVLFAFICLNISLRLFNVNYSFNKTKSLIGQILILLSFAALLQSLWLGSADSMPLGQESLPGGLIGNSIATVLFERLFLQFTPIFLFLVILFSIPLVLSMPLNIFLEYLGGVFLSIFNFFKKIFPKKEKDENFVEITEEISIKEPETVSELAGKGKLLKIKASAKPTVIQEEVKDKNKMVSDIASQPQQQIKFVEGSNEKGVFLNEQLKYPDWKLPPVSILNDFNKKKHSQENIKRNADIIEKTLESFGIRAKVVEVLIGPTVTQYAIDLPLGIKVSKIVNLAKDLALALATPANSIRLETPIPGTSYIGIEVPNEDREIVYLKEAMSDPKIQNPKALLPIAFGKDIHGEMVVGDLQKMPHLLVAGATGSGKSILTNGFIVSLLMTISPDQVKFIMIDPKQVELSDYNGIPHLLTPVITDMDKVLNALKWAVAEMENRYTIFREAHVKNIEAYNKLMGYSALPYIIFVIDEMADMMMSTNRVETEAGIVRLAQKARATGIHLLLATQRPSVNVITGLIKANIPGRVGMSVTTNIDSRVILDQIGAESLLGKGDMLFKDPAKPKPFRIQGIWVSPEEIQKIVQYIKKQVPEVEYPTNVTEFKTKEEEEKEGGVSKEYEATSGDDKDVADAIRVVVSHKKGSSSLLQRRLRFGYNKAARIMDELEELGVVGPTNGSKPREVYVEDAEAFISSTFGGGNETEEQAVTEEENDGSSMNFVDR